MRKLLLPLLALLLFTACKKDNTANGKVDVCHYDAVKKTWKTINISVNALPAHLAHGDVVPDADEDGFTKINPCGNGSQNDCDDNNAAIKPGATEICGDGIDNNCNGQVDENCFASVTIGNQTWMQKNLDVSTYRNGDAIPQVTDLATLQNITTGAWCISDDITDGVPGKLYNWYAVNDSRGMAPQGWHVPSNTEWSTLITSLGGSNLVFDAMASPQWVNGTATPLPRPSNSSGFTATQNGVILGANYSGFLISFWWSSSQSGTYWSLAGAGAVGTINSGDNFPKTSCLSVRCVKD